MSRRLLAVAGLAGPPAVLAAAILGGWDPGIPGLVALWLLGAAGYAALMALSLGCSLREVVRAKQELPAVRQLVWNLGLLLWLFAILALHLIGCLHRHGIAD